MDSITAIQNANACEAIWETVLHMQNRKLKIYCNSTSNNPDETNLVIAICIEYFPKLPVIEFTYSNGANHFEACYVQGTDIQNPRIEIEALEDSIECWLFDIYERIENSVCSEIQTLDERDVEEMVDDLLDVGGTVEIAGLTFYPSRIVKELDAVAYREIRNNYCDGEKIIDHPYSKDCWCYEKELEEAMESFKDSIENERTDKIIHKFFHDFWIDQ